MAELFWVKDGTASDSRTSKPQRVTMKQLLEKLTPFEKRYSVVPHDFNPAHGPAKPGEPYRHVVVRVDDVETNSNFPESGYYEVVGLTPDDSRELFGLKGA